MNDSKLIVNADDFGIGEKITDVIIDCHLNGIVTSTTLMANMPTAEYACKRAKDLPSLGVGIHLTLTAGRPVSQPNEIADLLDEQGGFIRPLAQRKKLYYGTRIAQQVEKELTAQIRKTLDMGITPTHCDSHHGIHSLPIVRNVMLKILPQFGILKIRNQIGLYWTKTDATTAEKTKCLLLNLKTAHKTAFRRWNNYLAARADIQMPDRKVYGSMLIGAGLEPKQQLLGLLANLPTGVSEIIFHPGCPDPDVIDSPDFAKVRQIDTSLARDPDIAAAIKKHGIELISYKDI